MDEWKNKVSKISPKVSTYPEFSPATFTFDGVTKGVYKSGKGPGIVIIHEVPGIYDKVFDFARILNDQGFTTYLPSLMGEPGKDFSNGYALKGMAKLCVAKEFNRFARGKEAPIASWLRALARFAHKECGGPGVGAVGMCFSGGFALAMMADEHVIAPVLSQPSMPFRVNKKLSYDIDTNAEDIEKIKDRLDDLDSCVLAMRFSGDTMVPGDRFKFLKDKFGDRFEGVTIDSSPGNEFGIPLIAHSVLTKDFVDKEGHPTRTAMDKVLTLFNKQLHGKS